MNGNTVRAVLARMLVVCALVLALAVGVMVPQVALASGPHQAPPATDLAASVGTFIDLLIALAVGGGVAYLLQMSGKWTDWRSPFKPVVVIALTALLGAALTALKVAATPELFALAPEWARAFISFIVVFVGSQVAYQKGFA